MIQISTEIIWTWVREKSMSEHKRYSKRKKQVKQKIQVERDCRFRLVQDEGKSGNQQKPSVDVWSVNRIIGSNSSGIVTSITSVSPYT